MLAPVLFLGLLGAVGCDSRSAEAPPPAAAAASDGVASESASAVEAPTVDAPDTRMVVRTAELEIRTDELDSAMSSITAMAEGLGGYVSNGESTGAADAVRRVDATLRVPSDRFDDALANLRGRGEIIRDNVQGQDVTEQYSDLEAQIRSHKVMEERLLAFLSKTEDLDDTLRLESELVRIRSTIETFEGRRNLLEKQAAMATVRVVLVHPTQVNEARAETASSQLDRALDDAGDAFLVVLGGLIRLLGVLLPLLLVGTPIAYATHFGLKRRRARRQRFVPPPAPTNLPPRPPAA